MTRIIVAPGSPAAPLDAFCRGLEGRRLYVVADAEVCRLHAAMFKDSEVLSSAPRLEIEAGEEWKTISTVERIWQFLSSGGATRSSVVVCVGGGMVTDTAGFAAATFKRGIDYLNVPTTLLGAVDASVGGKTGVNLGLLKNEVGAFRHPLATVVSPAPFATLPHPELISGYAEMIKTGLISSPGLYRKLMDVEGVLSGPEELSGLMRECISFKAEVTGADLCEQSRRKILNFGHTAGHAFESLAREKGRPVPHGVAVAAGITVALALSHMLEGMESGVLYEYCGEVWRPFFPNVPYECADRDRVLELMGHDKKNLAAGRPRFVLLGKIGEPCTDIEVSAADIGAALDIMTDLRI